MSRDAFDVVVLGCGVDLGGVAGCAPSARPSEDPGRPVRLVEAGPDHGPGPAAPAQLPVLATVEPPAAALTPGPRA
ncbi:hypothetical protein [Streptomyces sp. NPDC058486]|uniref:hypothetical protein n=1 Tax=unclassified Streptomyces TaxID=2593676 RepID=UPI003663F699